MVIRMRRCFECQCPLHGSHVPPYSERIVRGQSLYRHDACQYASSLLAHSGLVEFSVGMSLYNLENRWRGIAESHKAIPRDRWPLMYLTLREAMVHVRKIQRAYRHRAKRMRALRQANSM